MNKLISRFSLLICALLMNNLLFAQDKVEMADLMRSNGKIYVVVTVCLMILIGLFLYVMMLDRKIRKMEKGE